MHRDKHSYETTFIINASIEDSQIEALITRSQEAIVSNGGEIQAVNKWGRKRLSYPIEKKNNGYYVNLEFIAPGHVVARMEHTFLLDENVLRFLTVQLSKNALQARQQALKSAPSPQVAPPPPPVPVVEQPVEPAPVSRAPLFDDDANVSDAVKPS